MSNFTSLATEQYRGIDDESIIPISRKEKRIILTQDKDFSGLVFSQKEFPFSVILLRTYLQTKQNLEKTVHDILQWIEQQQIEVTNSFIVFDGISFRIRTF